jgi:hypothetical protein
VAPKAVVRDPLTAKVSEVQSTDDGGNSVVTPHWQVFGHDDPNFH